MPHVRSVSGADRGPSSDSSSSTDPPEGTSTELYRPVERQAAADDAATATSRAAGSHEMHHGRALSYSSEVDMHENAGTLMPTRKHVKKQAASPSSLRRCGQQHAVVSPSPPSSHVKSAATRAEQSTHPAVRFSSHREASPPSLLPSSKQNLEATSSSAFSQAPQTHAAPSSHSRGQRAGVVDNSGYHYSTRTRAPLQGSQLLPPSPPASSQQPLQRRSPYMNYQSTSNVTEATRNTTTAMPLLPAPLGTGSTPPSTPRQAEVGAAAASSAADVPEASNTSSTAQWQLSSPECHRHRSDGHVAQRGVVFEYASQAVTTLEQQYGDALQRLSTMHRLYDRLDAHNRTLASELKRVRQVSDVLQNGIAFHLYNSVRQVKHEMKLLKRYVELLSSSFSDQLHVLQQVIGEELPHGAEGRLQPIETRVSISTASGGACSLEGVSKAPSSVLDRHVNGARGAAGVGTQFYSEDYWWNIMSPHPIRPRSAAHTQAALRELETGICDDAVNGHGSGTTDDARVLSPPGHLPPSIDDSRENDRLMQSSGEALVSHRAYQQVQEALAEAQRRVIELTQASSNQQADYENRIAQLKAAHRAKEATLKEELTLQRRRVELAQGGELQPIALSTELSSPAGGPMPPVDVNQLVQLLREYLSRPPSEKQHAGALSAGSSPTETGRPLRHAIQKSVRSPLRRWTDANETTGEKDSPPASASASRTDDGNGDVRLSLDRTKQRVLRETARKSSSHHRTGTDSDRHMPDRYSSAAAARRVERARAALGCEAHDGERRQQGVRAHSGTRHKREVVATEAAGSTSTVRRSLAYDRLMDHAHAVSKSLEGHASHIERSAERTRPCTVNDAGGPSVPKRCSSRRWQSTSGAARDAPCDVGAGPEMLQSLLARVEAISVQDRSLYAGTAPKRGRPVHSEVDAKVDRVAQGMWAQQVLKERNCL